MNSLYKELFDTVYQWGRCGVVTDENSETFKGLLLKIKKDDTACPFCGDTGFDAIGLKAHLLHGGVFHDPCDVFTNTLKEDVREKEKV